MGKRNRTGSYGTPDRFTPLYFFGDRLFFTYGNTGAFYMGESMGALFSFPMKGARGAIVASFHPKVKMESVTFRYRLIVGSSSCNNPTLNSPAMLGVGVFIVFPKGVLTALHFH